MGQLEKPDLTAKTQRTLRKWFYSPRCRASAAGDPSGLRRAEVAPTTQAGDGD